MVTPFSIDIDPQVIGRIRDRVLDFRWPREPDDADWQYGAPHAFMQRVQRYWLDRYDWTASQRWMNGWSHFRAESNGLRLHFVHQRSAHAGAIPLVVVHGWPGSFVEYLDVLRPLAGDAAQPFDVVAVSLPGYGFSDAPPRPTTPRQIAAAINQLMVEQLGYPAYMAHGGDWGSMVCGWLAFDYPETCRALHWTMLGLSPAGSAPGLSVATIAPPRTDEEHAWFARNQAASVSEFGYAAIQATKPLTLSYALTDSPMGVAAWILEKFQGWTDRGDGDVDELIPLDTLLTNIMLYLVTDGFGPASWMYRSLMTEGNALPAGGRISVPMGMAAAAHDVLAAPPRSYVEQVGNLVHWTQLPRGGHFLALEQPDALIRDLRSFAGVVANQFHVS